MDNSTSISDLKAKMPLYRQSFNSDRNTAEHLKGLLDTQQIIKYNPSFGNSYKIYDGELNKAHNLQKNGNDITIFYQPNGKGYSYNYTFSSSENGDKVSMYDAFYGAKRFSVDYTDKGFYGGYSVEDENDYLVSYESYMEDDELVQLHHERLSDGQNFLDDVLCNRYDKDNNLVKQHHVVTNPEHITTEDTDYDYDNNQKTQKIQNIKTLNDYEKKSSESIVENTKVQTWSLKGDKEQLDSVAIDTDNKDGFDEFYKYEYSQDGKLLKEYFNDINNPDSDYIIQHNYNEMGIEESKSIDYKVNDNWGFFDNLIDSVSSLLGFSSKKDATIENKFIPELQQINN